MVTTFKTLQNWKSSQKINNPMPSYSKDGNAVDVIKIKNACQRTYVVADCLKFGVGFSCHFIEKYTF